MPFVRLRFALKLAEHNVEFNPSGAVAQSSAIAPSPNKRRSDADSSRSTRPKLEGLEEANLDKLMEAGPVRIANHAKYILLLGQSGMLWIAAKIDMVLHPHDVLFSFGGGRRMEHC